MAVVFWFFVVLEISEGNRVIFAGASITFTCHWLSISTPAYWHFYSLKSGAAPCSFNSSQLHPGISLCSSAPRMSLANSYYSRRNKTTLTISKAQLSDAGTYICGSRNPRSLSTAYSVIVGVIGTCIHVHHDGLGLLQVAKRWHAETTTGNAIGVYYSVGPYVIKIMFVSFVW